MRPVARLTSLAALAAALAACGAEPLSISTSEAEPACVPRGGGHARICGLAPPHRGAAGERAYKLTTITGASFWLTLPDDLAPSSGAVAVPSVPVRVNAGLTTAPPRAAADRYCDGFPACEPTVVSRERLPQPLVRWDDASGSIRDLAITTLDLGAWTLVLPHPDAGRAERVARAISASVDADGYPRLASTAPGAPLDRDWAGVLVWVPDPDRPGEYHVINVIPGCELTTKEPDGLGGSDAGPALELHEPDTVAGGSWCVGGRYWVDVAFAARPTLERLHETLTVIPAAGGPAQPGRMFRPRETVRMAVNGARKPNGPAG